jgi:endonuclease III
MVDSDIHDVMAILKHLVTRWQTPAVTIVAQRQGNPFKVLISCILSLRTQDRVTAAASERLFSLAETPSELASLPLEVIENAVYPVGFYHTKARQIKDICRELLEKHGSRVPSDIDDLLRFKGVGRKTANLVVTLGFAKPGICVDTHVHRISNRWGYVKTRTPEETEFALRDKLPKKYWLVINDYLVAFGQNLCTPISPRCSMCPLFRVCDRVGVGKSR